MAKLIIKDLYASANGVMILKGINLTLDEGETVALMGPNGRGKSTLAYVIMGHPAYKIEKGSIDKKISDNDIEDYYNHFNEEGRLDTRHGQVEFFVTMHYIHEIIGNRKNLNIK